MDIRNGASSPLRRYRVLAAFISAVAVLGALAVVGWLAHWPSGVFGGSGSVSAPAGAVTAVTGLASRDPAALRAALAVGFPVSAGDVAPAGTSIRVQSGTWQQRGEYATVRAVVTLPGRAPLAETVYFVLEGGRWRVLFADRS